MKNKILVFAVLVLFLSCKNELVKTPKRLIEKEKMINIMYDLALLDAIKNQNILSKDSVQINPNQYIYKKYKIDSLQFAQNNVYYSSEYKEYKLMIEKIKSKIDADTKVVEAAITKETKRIAAQKIVAEKRKAKIVADSLKKIKINWKNLVKKDSLSKLKKIKIKKKTHSEKKK